MNASLWRRRAVPTFSNSRSAMTDEARDERARLLQPAKRPYIPLGCDQQGRMVPTRLQRQHADFVDTIPTGPMPLGDHGAAHAAGALDDDRPAGMGEGAGLILWPLLGGAFVLFVVVPLVAHLWARWF